MPPYRGRGILRYLFHAHFPPYIYSTGVRSSDADGAPKPKFSGKCKGNKGPKHFHKYVYEKIKYAAKKVVPRDVDTIDMNCETIFPWFVCAFRLTYYLSTVHAFERRGSSERAFPSSFYARFLLTFLAPPQASSCITAKDATILPKLGAPARPTCTQSVRVVLSCL